MDKDTMIIFFGFVAIISLTVGAFAFGKTLSEREIPSIDERINLMQIYRQTSNDAEKRDVITALGKARRPLLTLNFSAAGECESFFDSAQFYFDQASRLLTEAGGADAAGTAYAALPSGDRTLFDSMLVTGTQMADAYDNCLGNP